MSISVGGLTSGLDTSSIVSQLVQIERRPIDILESQRATKEVKLTSFQTLNTKLSSLMSVSKEMDTTDDFLVKKGTFTNGNASDNNSVISLSTTSSVTAGSFNIVTSQLALANKFIHSGVDDQNASITTTTGNFSFTYAGTTTNISVTANSTTLAGLKNAINSANAGITATIINTGDSSSNYKLILTGGSTGEDNTISVDSSSVFGSGFTQQQAARNSTITIDGTDISRDSNLLTDVIEGVSINLDSIGSGTITFANDMTSVKGKINQFVETYNDLVSYVSKQLRYNSKSGTTGALFANSTVMNLQNTLKEIITSPVPGLSDTYTRLSQIGFKTDQTDGTISITEGELSDALEDDFVNVGKLFTSFGSTSDSRVTFVGFTEDTQAGTYELQGLATFAAIGFSGMRIREEGESSYRNMKGNAGSAFFSGLSGGDEEGLTLRIEADTFGDYGTVTLSLGIAAQLARELNTLTDNTTDGPITTEINALTDTIEDVDDQIEDKIERLVFFEEKLRSKFVRLEVQLSLMESQGSFLTSALAGLSAGLKR